jgi:biopolymer transport protein ExbD
MAFNLTSAGGGRRSRGLPAMAEINVTPFVDVALVLLIIFIITAHVMDYGIEVDVPKTKSVASTSKDVPVVVVMNKAGELFLGSTPVKKLLELPAAIHARYPGQTDVFFRADSQVTYGDAMQVEAELGAAKFNIKAVTQPLDSGTRH